MTNIQQPLAHRRELDLLALIRRVPEHDRGNYEALIHAAFAGRAHRTGLSGGVLRVG